MSDLKIPRMETIDNAARLFGLPKHLIRSKVISGEIVAVQIGRKYLVNCDKLLEYLNTSKVLVDTEKDSFSSGIKPVPVRI